MKLCICIALLALVGSSLAKNVMKVDLQEGKETDNERNKNVLYFDPVEELPLASVTCSDGSKCPNGNTCCKDTRGAFACCPLPQAVCCEDHVHCCPSGYTCDVSGGKCNKGDSSTPLSVKTATIPSVGDSLTDDDAVPCPGGAVSCPSQTTCCEMVSGDYGCCPLPKAVCCADRIHCCPSGYKCDVSAGTCNKGSNVFAWLPKQAGTPAFNVLPRLSEQVDTPSVEAKIVVCPDQSSCQDGSTCCLSEDGGYACCPLPNAVCCGDKQHCCPSGYTCDVATGVCNNGNDIKKWFRKVAAKPSPEVNSVTCADQSTCPDGSTCCQDQQGGYACCPLPQAVCCSDKLHCCPNGYTCDTAAGRCNKGNEVLTWFTKLAAKPAPELNSVTCADQSTCPDGSTCCAAEQGGYACCPLPQAVCCSDKKHCCPSDYTCDVAAGRCLKGKDVLSWFTKVAAKPAPQVKSVTCPDQSTCPGGNTCCLDQQGGYACCPLPQAQCCSDKQHCCPNGYTCDTAAGRCLKGNDVLTWFTKTTAKPAPEVNAVTCPDQSTCPGGNTCCEDQQGGYACCPHPNAACCSDKLHCCPNGYTCDVAERRCNKGNDVLSWFTKVAAKPAPEVNSVTCADQSTCPDGSTCCLDQQGGYACCPLPQAVCCSDKQHCCPNGYTCDVGSGRCKMGRVVITWFTKLPAKPAPTVKSVECPDQSSCPDGSTCCELASGKYGCCPSPNATCCSDHVHCCPNGYKCEVGAGKCYKGNSVITWLTKQAAKPASTAFDVHGN